MGNQRLISKCLKIKVLFQSVKMFIRKKQIRSLELYQFYVAEIIRLLAIISERNVIRIKILLKEKVAKILAIFFKTTYLTTEIRWRLSCLITSICSLSLVYVGTTKEFIQEFWKEGGIKAILNQLEQADNYKTIFSIFCALCELTCQKEVLKDLLNHNDVIKTVLINTYYAFNKRILNLNCLDGLLDRLSVLLNNSTDEVLFVKTQRILKSADTISFLKILALLNHTAFGTSQERFTLHIKYRALEALANLIKNDSQSQDDATKYLKTFIQHGSQFIYKQFPRFLTALAYFFKSICYNPIHKANVSILSENFGILRSIYDCVTKNLQTKRLKNLNSQNIINRGNVVIFRKKLK